MVIIARIFERERERQHGGRGSEVEEREGNRRRWKEEERGREGETWFINHDSNCYALSLIASLGRQ